MGYLAACAFGFLIACLIRLRDIEHELSQAMVTVERYRRTIAYMVARDGGTVEVPYDVQTRDWGLASDVDSETGAVTFSAQDITPQKPRVYRYEKRELVERIARTLSTAGTQVDPDEAYSVKEHWDSLVGVVQEMYRNDARSFIGILSKRIPDEAKLEATIKELISKK